MNVLNRRQNRQRCPKNSSSNEQELSNVDHYETLDYYESLDQAQRGKTTLNCYLCNDILKLYTYSNVNDK